MLSKKSSPRGGKRLAARRESTPALRWSKLLLALYLGGMLYLLFFQRHPYGGPLSYGEYIEGYLNVVPFDTVRRMIWAFRHGSAAFAWRNLAGNVVLFLPLGVFLPLLWDKLRRWWACLLTAALLVFCVEGLQLVTTLGSADVDDLILNTLGAMLGYAGWRAVVCLRAKE